MINKDSDFKLVETICYVILLQLGLWLICAVPFGNQGYALDLEGEPPNYSQRKLHTKIQIETVSLLAWSPGLNRGYIPQGVTVIGREIFLSAYRQGGERPKCIIFRMDSTTGKTLGEHAVGEYCSHAGGLAYTGTGRLFLSDTRRLYEIMFLSPKNGYLSFNV